jgi:hypothetical protein
VSSISLIIIYDDSDYDSCLYELEQFACSNDSMIHSPILECIGFSDAIASVIEVRTTHILHGLSIIPIIFYKPRLVNKKIYCILSISSKLRLEYELEARVAPTALR